MPPISIYFSDLAKWVWSKAPSYGGSDEYSTESTSVGFTEETDVDVGTETMILHIYAGNTQKIRQAKQKVDAYIEEESTSEV